MKVAQATPTLPPIGPNQIDTYLTFEQNVAGDRLFPLYYLLAWLILPFLYSFFLVFSSSASPPGRLAVH